ncbi:hypothetical protein, partial [Borrelia coriaceae]|uniref:hypothetical protein n=1 Tax=Borrelia coriaceae TaxID=144 RepID=UPI00057017C8
RKAEEDAAKVRETEEAARRKAEEDAARKDFNQKVVAYNRMIGKINYYRNLYVRLLLTGAPDDDRFYCSTKKMGRLNLNTDFKPKSFDKGRHYIYLSLTNDLEKGETGIEENYWSYLVPLLDKSEVIPKTGLGICNEWGKSVYDSDGKILYDSIDSMYVFLYYLSYRLDLVIKDLHKEIIKHSVSTNSKFNSEVIIRIDDALQQIIDKRTEFLDRAINVIKSVKDKDDQREIKDILDSLFVPPIMRKFSDFVDSKWREIVALIKSVA